MAQEQEEQHRRENISKFADHRPRDKNGHFIPSSKPTKGTNPVGQFVKQFTSVEHNTTTKDDTLVDVHVNNPLKKITQLLEDIKKQKAFAFTIKGSLGIAGVALVLTTFGILGGTQAFCNKGEQSHLGTIKILHINETSTTNSLFIRIQNVWYSITDQPLIVEQTKPKVILIQQDNTVYKLQGLSKTQLPFAQNTPYIATGTVDSCSQTITVSDPQAIEPM